MTVFIDVETPRTGREGYRAGARCQRANIDARPDPQATGLRVRRGRHVRRVSQGEGRRPCTIWLTDYVLRTCRRRYHVTCDVSDPLARSTLPGWRAVGCSRDSVIAAPRRQPRDWTLAAELRGAGDVG